MIPFTPLEFLVTVIVFVIGVGLGSGRQLVRSKGDRTDG
jgi:hypothetical protein